MARTMSLLEFEAKLLAGEAMYSRAAHAHMEESCKILQQKCRDALGHYQAGDGQFPSWEGLYPETMERRARWGFPEDEPLLLTAALRNAIDFRVTERGRGVVGVASAIVPNGTSHGSSDIGVVAVVHEMGSPDKNIPQRSFLGLPAQQNGAKIARRYFGKTLNSMFGFRVVEVPKAP